MTEEELQTLMQNIGAALKKQRIALGLSRKDVAQALDVRISTVGNWEEGDRFPKLKYWRDLLKILHYTSVDDLFRPVLNEIQSEPEDSETALIINRVHRICMNPEYRDALSTLLEGFTLTPEEKRKARGSPNSG